jgi:TRAP-type mannitol/chloroaromatic compound transport system permease large subunit
MQHVWVLIVLFGAGMLVTALATQSVALGMGAAGTMLLALGERRNWPSAPMSRSASG